MSSLSNVPVDLLIVWHALLWQWQLLRSWLVGCYKNNNPIDSVITFCTLDTDCSHTVYVYEKVAFSPVPHFCTEISLFISITVSVCSSVCMTRFQAVFGGHSMTCLQGRGVFFLPPTVKTHLRSSLTPISPKKWGGGDASVKLRGGGGAWNWVTRSSSFFRWINEANYISKGVVATRRIAGTNVWLPLILQVNIYTHTCRERERSRDHVGSSAHLWDTVTSKIMTVTGGLKCL